MGACKSVYHLKCADITVSQLTEMKLSGIVSRWTCSLCHIGTNHKEIPSSFKSTDDCADQPSLSYIAQMIRDLMSENILLRKSITETHTKLDEQTSKLEELINKTKELEVENQKLKIENVELQASLDEQEQYSRRNCVEIHGMPEVNGEVVVSEVIKIGRAIGMEITPYMIDNCHRLGRQNASSPAIRGILVKFLRNLDKENFLKCRKIKRSLTSSDLGFQTPNSAIYINENLTQYRRSLLSATRKLRKACNIMYVWTRNGKIYLRENEKTPVVNVSSESVLSAVEKKCKEQAREILNSNA